MDPSEILSIAREIYCCEDKDKEARRARFSEKHKEFSERYPHLFEMCCAGDIDERKLSMMVGLLARVRDESITEHDASVRVGQMLVDEYVMPHVPADVAAKCKGT
jgi:hypothetical protein